MAEELDGCHVGLGRCLGLVHDHIGDIEIQCCWTRPGNRELILTGNLSSVSREAIWNIKDLVQQSIPGISSRLGLCAEGLSLIKQGHDLHVHVENGFHPVGPSYQMGAIYLSMVSLLISQRPRKDVVVLGDVGNATGAFSSAWDVGQSYMGYCQQLGYRHVILGDGTNVTPEAEIAAGQIQGDGQPLVRLTFIRNILDALSLCFHVPYKLVHP